MSNSLMADQAVKKEYRRVGVAEFKNLIGATTLNVVRNPHTNKLFLSASNGQVYRVQQDIDLEEEVEMLVVDGVVDDACLVNAGKNNVLATL